MIIDCISDLHGEEPELEGGDILIVAGDLTATHKPQQFKQFFNWLMVQDYKYKVVIAGNHDSYLQESVMYGQISMNLGGQFDQNENFNKYAYYYLCEAQVVIEGLKFFGTPWTKTFEGIEPNCMAFTMQTEKQLSDKWKIIPDDTDILITHCPPYGIFDEVLRRDHTLEYTGSMSLRNEVIERIKPKLHVFGHIHQHGGKKMNAITTQFVNASILDEYYDATNEPVRIIL